MSQDESKNKKNADKTSKEEKSDLAEEKTEEPTPKTPPPPKEPERASPPRISVEPPAQPIPPEPRREAPPPVKPEEEIKGVIIQPTGVIQRFVRLPGIKQVKSLVTRRVFRPIAVRFLRSRLWKRLAKTAIGQAIKTGIKVAAKQGIKLGVKAGIEAAIIAAGISAAGVGVIVSAIVNIAIEVGSLIIEKVIKPIFEKTILPILKKIKSLTGDWKSSLVLIGAGILTIVAGPPILFAGGVALIGIGVAGLAFGGAAGGALAATGAFITSALFAPYMIPVTLFITALVVGTIVGLMALTLFIIITTAGAFIVPEMPVPEVSPYFEVLKYASRREIPNEELAENPCVTYNIMITAPQPIEISSIIDERTVVCDPSNTNNPQVTTPKELPHPAGPITSWSWPKSDDPLRHPYKLCFDETFADCRICNTVTVTANVVGGETGERASDTRCVNIGEPPEDCPSGWPTPNGYITQGPNTPQEGDGECTSHYGQEAIDIGNVGIGTDVYATHRGTPRWGNSENGGLYVAISGNCEGNFTSYYYHLSSINFDVMGEEVAPGTKIGETGNTGIYSEGAHLHYEFVGLEMDSRYIPISDDVLENCCTICGSCHDKLCPDISW